jgi:hypothetical protein
MYGFPIGNGNAGFNDFVEKFTNNADSGFPNIQQREVFYSIKDGLWSDTNTWQTASGRVGILPTANDDVYIRHSVTNTALNNVSINNLFITGTFNYGNTGFIMSIFGNIKCTGILNHTNNGTINLYGSDNYINTYNFNAVEPVINYARNDGIPQPIMPIIHGRITMTGISDKYLVADFVQGTSSSTNLIQSTFDTRGYNVNFTTGIIFNSSGDFISNGSTLVFGGAVSFTNLRRYEIINSILEFRGGWTWNPPIGTFANSVINFTTNTQNVQVSFSGAGAHIIDANSVNIVGNITLNIAAAGTDYLVLNCPINGTTASSNLINKGFLQFGNTASVPSMSTGVFDFTTFANTINYGGNYSATIPSYFTTFYNLTISGTGTKTLGVNTTLNGNLTITGGNIELSSYNLTVTGTTTGANTCSLSKSGSGNILFIGNASFATSGGLTTLNFSGNPNIEFRGGASFGFYPYTSFDSGTGQWTFSTNSQTAILPNGLTIKGNILISGAITLTIATANRSTYLEGTINGNNALSNLVLQTGLYFKNAATNMTTGTFDFTTSSTAVVGFVQNGNYTIPYTTFAGLYIGGIGTKTLSGNTTVSRNLTIYGDTSLYGSGTNILECSIYDLTVSNTTFVHSQTLTSTFSKNGSGNILFIGQYTHNQFGGNLVLSGNPNVEYRGGLDFGAYAANSFNSGTGNWTFTTNNQSFNVPPSTIQTLNCAVLISGAITLTITGSGRTINSIGTINGNNASSILLMGASTTLNYQSATQPMATGVLDTSTNLNTWIYGLNNQNILGGPSTGAKQVYRNLTLNGTGVKTLQGYVSVLNTYTLTSPATLALNGFTLTNP